MTAGSGILHEEKLFASNKLEESAFKVDFIDKKTIAPLLLF